MASLPTRSAIVQIAIYYSVRVKSVYWLLLLKLQLFGVYDGLDCYSVLCFLSLSLSAGMFLVRFLTFLSTPPFLPRICL